ncbi:MAG: hypothetical protein WCO51_10300 [bacterium]|jgi:hypothetical protein
MNIHWGRIITGLVIIFGAGGTWHTTGLDAKFPEASPWVTFILAIAALFISPTKQGETK